MKKYLSFMLILCSTIMAGCVALPVTTQVPGRSSPAPDKSLAITLSPDGAISLAGSGSAATAPFALKAGTIALSWKYQARPGEMAAVAAAQAKHQSALDALARPHQDLIAAINQDMKTDLLDGDPNGYNLDQQEISQENNKYAQAVASEDGRYQDEIAGIATPFMVKISRKSKDQPVTILSVKATYQGTARFDGVDASDYFFIISASGTYQIQLTRSL